MTAWIGLTGGIGSGKSQAAAYFSDLGVPVIDADALNRQIIEDTAHPALRQIRTVFGAGVLTDSGSLNKAQIRDLIFQDPKAKQQLEQILHPYIIQAIVRQQQQKQSFVYGLVEIPILAEHPVFRSVIQRVLLIHSPQAVRVRRVMQRNGWDEAKVHAIIRNQADDSERLAIADDVICNDGSLKQLQAAVAGQHRNYLQQFAV